MKDSVKMWKCKLAKEIEDYARCPVTPETLHATKKLAECWLMYDDMCKHMGEWDDTDSEEDGHVSTPTPSTRLTAEDIKHWNDTMLNADGTKGGHWTEEQTSSLAGSLGVYFEHITSAEWNVTCNMMYSDYFMVAKDAGISNADFFGKMAKAFLFDRDGPGPAKKLCAYYHNVAHPKHD